MPSADAGAPAVRPADVERWFVEIGLEPLERADREGIASWDLVLDGRRRHDLRVTVILDPSLAVIVWAHYAPPIGDMFRRSYRKLLRWNDEFPFVEVLDRRRRAAAPGGRAARSVRRTRMPLASPSRRILDVADRLLDESRDWLWAGGAVPAEPADRPAAQPGIPGPVRRTGCPPPRTTGPDDRHDPPARRRSSSPSSSRSASSVSPIAAAPVRAATPDLTIVSDARYDVQPAQKRVRVTVALRLDEPPQGHRDQAVLLRSGLPGRPARFVRLQADRRVRRVERLGLEADRECHDPAAASGIAAVQRQVRDVHPALRPRRPRRHGHPRPADRRFAGVVPGLGLRLGRHAGQHRHRRLPGRV